MRRLKSGAGERDLLREVLERARGILGSWNRLSEIVVQRSTSIQLFDKNLTKNK